MDKFTRQLIKILDGSALLLVVLGVVLILIDYNGFGYFSGGKGGNNLQKLPWNGWATLSIAVLVFGLRIIMSLPEKHKPVD